MNYEAAVCWPRPYLDGVGSGTPRFLWRQDQQIWMEKSGWKLAGRRAVSIMENTDWSVNLARAQPLAATAPPIYRHFYSSMQTPKIFITTIMDIEKQNITPIGGIEPPAAV